MAAIRYQELLAQLKEKIRQARAAAVYTVQYQMLAIYWEIGHTIDQQEKAAGWGAKTIERLSRDLKIEFTDMGGLSPRNLRYMREFFKAYPDFLILQPLAAKLESQDTSPKNGKKNISILQPPAAKLENTGMQLVAFVPWTHQTIILDKVKTLKERLFYLQQTVKQGWSKNILSLQIDAQLYERQGKAITNFKTSLPPLQSDLAQETFKSPYLLDFLDIGIEIKEKDLERALIKHINKYLLELGRGFAYMGNQYKITVEGDEFFLDLLFFNTHLNCYVIFELKVGPFKSEYAGKLNFYINAVDNQIKGKKHNKTIGILMCQTPNKTEVRYALEGIKKPMAVSDYKLAKALPKELKGEIPSIAELEEEMQNELEKLKTPTEKRFDIIKMRIAAFDKDKVETAATFELLTKLFYSSFRPLYENLLLRFKGFEEDFITTTHYWFAGNNTIKSLEELESLWKDEKKLREHRQINFVYRLCGFKPAGVDSSDTSVQLNLILDDYSYQFVLVNKNNQPFKKKLYTQALTKEDIQEICDLAIDQGMNWMERYLE